MKKFLIIDGNYFAHRVLGQLNMQDSVNNIETEIEINNFNATLNSSLLNLYNTFNNDYVNLIDNIIFVVDNQSWRKTITPYKPYYITDDTPLSYKENRDEIKEKSSINYNNFHLYFKQFVSEISKILPVFNVQGLEGDDIIMLLSNKFRNNPDIECVVFCNDGDINQTVKDNFCLFRNIKSKEAPDGEFVISMNKFNKIFNKNDNIKNVFLNSNTFDNSFFKELFQIKIGSQGNIKIKRELNSGISIATPFTTAMIKSICGDKKDNIFPILRWKSSTGTKNFKVTENHIDKVCKKIFNQTLSERTCQQLYSNYDMLKELIKHLIIETKQTDYVKYESVLMHLAHNMLINILTIKNIPDIYVNDFNLYFDNLQDKLYTNIKLDEFRKLINRTNLKDKAIEIYEKSIPDINQILK